MLWNLLGFLFVMYRYVYLMYRYVYLVLWYVLGHLCRHLCRICLFVLKFNFKPKSIMEYNFAIYNMKKENNELQSRREFFKKAAKGALPILGAVILANVPNIVKAEETPMGCSGACSSNCVSSCQDTCLQNCKGSCKNSCRQTCKGTCKGSARY